MRYHASNKESTRLAYLWESVLTSIYDEYLDKLLKKKYTNPLLALADVMDGDFDSLDTIVLASDQDFSSVIKKFQEFTYYDTRPKTGHKHLRKQAKVKEEYSK